ncbi:DUF3461 family protein [Neptunomonas concharum]|uniref:DUF3461 family protein n=1 Tax=Neptunomonas concharum TaxID=1031538 RepID=A0A5P1R7N9_9GAMM|nr:DUF3461 family protein [Neptunomonas concharum]QEQ95618.1 DUF3461 family protein [Neptunomonas concharum]
MSAEKFPTLIEMGIDEPHDIERYTSRIEGDVDILKIYFHRHQGDWMAKSKKFKFKRMHKNMRVNEGRVPYIATTESSPYFLRAVAELDQLVAEDKSAQTKKQRLLDDIEHLEKVVSRKIEDMRRQIEEL